MLLLFMKRQVDRPANSAQDSPISLPQRFHGVSDRSLLVLSAWAIIESLPIPPRTGAGRWGIIGPIRHPETPASYGIDPGGAVLEPHLTSIHLLCSY